MTDHNLVSIDLAKTVFQVCRFADDNKILSNKKVSRKKLNQQIAELSPTTGGSWGQVLRGAFA